MSSGPPEDGIARIAGIIYEDADSERKKKVDLTMPRAPSSSSTAPASATGLRFDGKVAVVTGAGNGLGKEYAKELASRGAKVVVNDLGCKVDGSGSSRAPAESTVIEIREAGGEAIANFDSVSDGDKIIQHAVSAYGRVDILINNAGVSRDASFRKFSDKDWDVHYKADLFGVYKCTHAAWIQMEKQNYGRIVMVSGSTALHGNFGQAGFCAMKGGALGFGLSLSQEGEHRGIFVNIIAPNAASRFSEPVLSKDLLAKLKPSTVSNMTVYLCHESCKSNGGVFELGGQHIAKVRLQRSQGVRFKDGFTVEDVADQFSSLCDFTQGAVTPRDGGDLIRREMAELKEMKSESGKAKKVNAKL